MGALMRTPALVLQCEFVRHLFKARAWRWSLDRLCGSWFKLCDELCCVEPFSEPKFYTQPEF